MSRGLKILAIAPLAILGMLLFIFIGGGVVMLLWNWLLPTLFGFPQITFWQALGLLALGRILFGGFGLHGSGRSRVRDRVEGRVSSRFAERLAERLAERVGDRWDAMTPEERERFRQRMRERCGFDPSTSTSESKVP